LCRISRSGMQRAARRAGGMSAGEGKRESDR
jgi:hypothetical protein